MLNKFLKVSGLAAVLAFSSAQAVANDVPLGDGVAFKGRLGDNPRLAQTLMVTDLRNLPKLQQPVSRSDIFQDDPTPLVKCLVNAMPNQDRAARFHYNFLLAGEEKPIEKHEIIGGKIGTHPGPGGVISLYPEVCASKDSQYCLHAVMRDTMAIPAHPPRPSYESPNYKPHIVEQHVFFDPQGNVSLSGPFTFWGTRVNPQLEGFDKVNAGVEARMENAMAGIGHCLRTFPVPDPKHKP